MRIYKKIYKQIQQKNTKFHNIKCKEKSEYSNIFICFFLKKLWDYIYKKFYLIIRKPTIKKLYILDWLFVNDFYKIATIQT